MACDAQFARLPLWSSVAVLFVAVVVSSTRGDCETPKRDGGVSNIPAAAKAPQAWQDSLRDGFPDAARLDRPADQATFVRWLTFLAESQFYVRVGLPLSSAWSPSSEIHDCAGLIRFAFRNALMAHNEAWWQAVGLNAANAQEPGFGDIQKFTYPHWVLGTRLFRTQAGPFVSADLDDGGFSQFADAATLLHYNTFPVSRDVRAAQAGDLLFYDQPGQSEAYHSMLFVGRSYFQPQGSDWVVYHTGDLDGRRGEVREVEMKLLMEHPDPRWRPLAANPRFLGVYRFELLR
jgi:uncharacterized protein